MSIVTEEWEPTVLVWLRGENRPVPLTSLGDGMNRVLGIMLALIAAKGGLLLIDEVENGLHYSVQADLWRLILEMAEQLDVQVLKIGLLVDAGKRWCDIRDILASSGYVDLPIAPLPEGTVIRQEGKPDVGCWIMPDNCVPGALEDFVRVLVPDADDLWALAESTVNGIPAAGRRFKAQDQLKAVVQAWLAWQKEPGTPIGMAVQRKYLDASAGPAQLLVAWLRNLFGVPTS